MTIDQTVGRLLEIEELNAALVAALEECYRVACHLGDKRTTPKRAIATIKTIATTAIVNAKATA